MLLGRKWVNYTHFITQSGVQQCLSFNVQARIILKIYIKKHTKPIAKFTEHIYIRIKFEKLSSCSLEMFFNPPPSSSRDMFQYKCTLPTTEVH